MIKTVPKRLQKGDPFKAVLGKRDRSQADRSIIGRIPKLWVAFLGEKTAISCIFRLTKGGDTPFVRRKMQDLAIFPSRKPYPQFGNAPILRQMWVLR